MEKARGEEGRCTPGTVRPAPPRTPATPCSAIPFLASLVLLSRIIVPHGVHRAQRFAAARLARAFGPIRPVDPMRDDDVGLQQETVREGRGGAGAAGVLELQRT